MNSETKKAMFLEASFKCEYVEQKTLCPKADLALRSIKNDYFRAALSV